MMSACFSSFFNSVRNKSPARLNPQIIKLIGQPPETPKEPGPYECCGMGCVDCIFTDYFNKSMELQKWKRKYSEMEKQLCDLSTPYPKNKVHE